MTDHPLTDRQLSVLKLMATGFSLKMTASAMGISPKTVGFHWAAVKRKLRVQTAVEAAHIALQRRLVKNLFEV